MTNTSKTIDTLHCECCASTDPEDLDGDQGYTACCNEPTAWGGDCSHCTHSKSDDDFCPKCHVEIIDGTCFCKSI